ncbi:MFS-type transporter SLC18B1-like [Ostrea edulis]|uniref:MFS-type transporter SLC18B1-like n=1 Tax=Ostrea edulis TaxID=37623 RepID=UPI0024AF4C16|nr:MFS-type transporter SLC18B1-like [Ostrea edulis]
MKGTDPEPVEMVPLITSDSSTDDESNIIHEKEDSDFSFSKIPKHKKILLAVTAFSNFLNVSCFSLSMSFFPTKAEKKGVPQTVIGIIFGVYELVIFLSSPILGNYMTRIGTKYMYLAGTMVGGFGALVFGVLDNFSDEMVYSVVCFLCRAMEGFGSSMFYTASFATITGSFPDNVGTALGLLQTSGGLGIIIGPAVGGALYELGGFGLPFFVVGSMIILSGTSGYLLIRHISDSPRDRHKSVFFLLKNPYTWVVSLTITVGCFAMGFNDSTLALHVENLAELKGKPSLIGLMFLICGLMHSITGPLYGYVIDKKGYVMSTMTMGSLTTAIAYLLMGPTPLIDMLPFEIWSVILSLFLLGVGLAGVIIPTFSGLMESAKNIGMDESMDTHGVVSGLFNSCFSLGAFLGASVGGALVDQIGNEWSTTFCAGLLIISAMVLVLYGYCNYLKVQRHNTRSIMIM